MMAFRQKKLWLLPFLALLLLAFDAAFLGRDGAIHVDSAGAKFPAFRTETLDGHTVTNEIFDGNTTAICVWVLRDEEGSRAALDHLSTLVGEQAKNVQFVGLVGDLKTGDGAEKRALAKSIGTELPSSFPQLMINDDFAPFLTRLRAAPTVCFVDNSGRLVGQPVVGDEPELVRRELSRLIEKNSPRSRALQKIQKAIF